MMCSSLKAIGLLVLSKNRAKSSVFSLSVGKTMAFESIVYPPAQNDFHKVPIPKCGGLHTKSVPAEITNKQKTSTGFVIPGNDSKKSRLIRVHSKQIS